jgi:monoamine oxidase
VVLTDRPWSVFPRAPDPGSRLGILESYSAGVEARRIAKIRESPLLLAVREAAAVFPELPDQFEGGAAKLWDEDEWARGACTWFKPGQMRSLLPLIGRSEGRLLFAGEHTSNHPGWMQGALASGAREVMEPREGTGGRTGRGQCPSPEDRTAASGKGKERTEAQGSWQRAQVVQC